MFCVVVLRYVQEMALALDWPKRLASKAKKLASEMELGIQQHAIVHHPEFGRIYAYEVDGLGGSLLMDDANIPSLLSIPYIGYQSLE